MLAVNTIHITNGSAFTERLNTLAIPGKILTWNEILCEGPSVQQVFSEDFIKIRKNFLKHSFGADTTEYDSFVNQFNCIHQLPIDEIILWFEYDLFCQINLSAIVTYLQQSEIAVPLYLVCSGKIDSEENLFALNALSNDQLLNHYKGRILLTVADINSLVSFWEIYNSDDPRPLQEITLSTNLIYLKDAAIAQLQRFPSENGLNKLEIDILNAIFNGAFENKKKLVEFMLKNQGIYGFGDLQIVEMVDRLSYLFNEQQVLKITDLGSKILLNQSSALTILKDETQFGGAKKYQYLCKQDSNILEKIA